MKPPREIVDERLQESANYVPGEFFRRELPCILSATRSCIDSLDTIIIDGYVWLDDQGRKGLGAMLYQALGSSAHVVGVAKSRFAGGCGVEVFRGASRRPLIVTAAGIDPLDAARHIEQMHGAHRIPTLIRRADHLSRYGGQDLA